MWTITLDLTLAAYLAKKPDRQVRALAKRYKRQTTNPDSRHTLSVIIASRQPATLVKRAYEELIS